MANHAHESESYPLTRLTRAAAATAAALIETLVAVLREADVFVTVRSDICASQLTLVYSPSVDLERV